jgi:tetratricopeptide (TPR) repeat protein
MSADYWSSLARMLRVGWLCFFSFLPFCSLGQQTVHKLLDNGFQENRHKAIRLYTRALALDYTNAEAYWRRGNEYYTLKKCTLALADLQHSLQVDSLFSYGQVISSRGQTYEMLGNYPAAIRDFTYAIAYEAAPDLNLHHGAVDEYYYHRGRTNWKNRDTLSALVDLDSALHHYSRHYYARTLRARIYCQQGNHKAAMADYTYLFQKAYPDLDFTLDPKSAADFYYWGIAKQHLGDSTYAHDLAVAKCYHYFPGKRIYIKGLR